MITRSDTHKHWLKENFTSVNEYLYRWVDPYSRDQVRWEFDQDPFLGKCVVEDWITNRDDPEENQRTLLDYIRQPAVFVILLLGMPDSGKTTTAYALADMLKEEYNIVHVAPLLDEDALPDWISWKCNPYKLTKGDFAIIDEASIQNNARRSMSKKNQDDLGWLAVGRHVGAKMIYITQMSSIADLNLTRWANVMMSKGYSTSAAGAATIERQHVADNPVLSYLRPEPGYAGVPSVAKDWAVVTAAAHTYMTYLPKPAFMSDQLSRAYMRYDEKAGGNQKLAESMAMRDAQIMLDNEHSADTIYQQMVTRGFHKPRKFWRLFTGEDKPRKDEDDYD